MLELTYHLSVFCRGYDVTWTDKQGKFHVAYPSAKIHGRCVGGERPDYLQGKVGTIFQWADGALSCTILDTSPCACPCHRDWSPDYITPNHVNHQEVQEDAEGA